MTIDEIDKLNMDDIHQILKRHFPIFVFIGYCTDIDQAGEISKYTKVLTAGQSESITYGMLHCEAERHKELYMKDWSDE